MMAGYVEYSSNNSGGDWWLGDGDWRALENAGWIVDWYIPGERYADKDGRWLGALATSAKREILSLGDAIREWESVTGKSASALGCQCCGTPHDFTVYSPTGEWLDSYSPSFPEYGDEYDD